MNKKKYLLLGTLMAISAAAIAAKSLIKPKVFQIAEAANKSASITTETPLIIDKSVPGRNFIPVFAFHNIDKAPVGTNKGTASLYVSPQEFEAMLKGLKDNGYQTVKLSEAANLLDNGQMVPKSWVALTFDDGPENFYSQALPLLEKYQAKASIYLMAGVSGHGYLTHKQVGEISRNSLIEIGSHTIWHPKLSSLSPEQQFEELKTSKEKLEKLIGRQVETICYPFGDYNQDIKRISKEVGYKYGLGYNNKPLGTDNDILAIDRIGVWPGFNIISFLNKLETKQ
jgi:peptidoglycan/xylan/chitin deacetylase (PgdA/CDA1 family)